MNTATPLSHRADTVSDAGHDSIRMFGRHGLGDFRQYSQQAIGSVEAAIQRAQSVFSGARPKDLAAAIASVDLDRPATDFQATLDELQALYFDHAVYFDHPRYAAHLNCPVANPAVAAEVITAAINSSMDTWDQSAGATLIEQELIAWTARRARMPATADGIFTSGGTQSNLMAMLLAREHYCSATHGAGWVQQHGLPPEAGRLRIFASQISHFSICKATAVLGLGHAAVVPVAVDDAWRMDSAALAGAVARSKAAGEIPIAVVATFGTTDFGSLDDVAGVAAVCRAHDLWLHVDAAYGCGLLASPTRGHECEALQAADSLTVDYHKSFFQPVACSALLVADGRNLGHVTHHADYLNPREAAEAGTPDQVNKSLQTTRRFDALKLWLTLRTVGPDAVGAAFDAGLALAGETYELMLAEPRFDLLHVPELGTIVFRFRPRMTATNAMLDALNDAIRSELAATGEAMIAATRVGGRRYLKFTLLNPQTGLADMVDLLALIISAGERLAEQRTSSHPSVGQHALVAHASNEYTGPETAVPHA